MKNFKKPHFFIWPFLVITLIANYFHNGWIWTLVILGAMLAGFVVAETIWFFWNRNRMEV